MHSSERSNADTSDSAAGSERGSWRSQGSVSTSIHRHGGPLHAPAHRCVDMGQRPDQPSVPLRPVCCSLVSSVYSLRPTCTIQVSQGPPTLLPWPTALSQKKMFRNLDAAFWSPPRARDVPGPTRQRPTEKAYSHRHRGHCLPYHHTR